LKIGWNIRHAQDDFDEQLWWETGNRGGLFGGRHGGLLWSCEASCRSISSQPKGKLGDSGEAQSVDMIKRQEHLVSSLYLSTESLVEGACQIYISHPSLLDPHNFPSKKNIAHILLTLWSEKFYLY
jgi:hypothetical protein